MEKTKETRKTILITGASGNLGRAAVEKFQEGHQVIAMVSPGKTLEYVENSNVAIFNADLSEEKSVNESIASILKEYKTIDAAILTVGGFAMSSIHNTDGAALRKMFDMNFNTAYFVAKSIFNNMMENGYGRIILIGSRPGLSPADGKKMVAYTLSKSLIFSLAEILNAEASGKNVTTSVIVPSTIDTPVNRQAMPNADFSTWVSPDQITDAMQFLISDASQALRQPVLKLYGNS